jgi:hypothetical protein
MAREPSIPGVRSNRGAITKNDGTWPLPPELALELTRAGQAPGPSGPVAALRTHPTSAAAMPLPSAAAPAFPRPPRPARPAGLSPALQDRWYEVIERHDALPQLDHFAALNLSYDSGSAQVQQAFSQLIARFHPDKLPPELELLQPYAVRIVARLNVARMQLAARRDRETYLRSLGRPAPSSASEPPPQAAGAAAAVARVRPERRMVKRPASVPLVREEPARPRRASQPPSAGVRLMRALRGQGLRRTEG